jgi:hypothetical protein
MSAGRVRTLELESQAGGRCRLRNPWAPNPVRLERAGARSERLEGELLEFATSPGERVWLTAGAEQDSGA